MFPFCPHCTQSLDQVQAPGQAVVCPHCKKEVGVVPIAEARVVVDQAEELIRGGTVARCPSCQQLVPLRTSAAARVIAPHYAKDAPRKVCPGAGKPIAAVPSAPVPQPQTGKRKDLSAYMTRDLIKVVACRKDANPTIELLTLEYLDKNDRVRLQIDALRDILGAGFRMLEYPATFKKPHLVMWSNATVCVIAKKHPQGGYQAMTDEEITAVLGDVRQGKQAFF